VPVGWFVAREVSSRGSGPGAVVEEVAVAKINLTYEHTLGRIDAKRALKAGLDEINPNLGLTQSWNDNVVTLTGSGATGGVVATGTVRNNAIDIEIDLPPNLSDPALVAEVERRTRNKLADALAPQAAT